MSPFSVQLTHKNELDALSQTRIQDLTQQDQRHELEVSGIQKECEKKVEEVKAKWQQNLLEVLEQKKEELGAAEKVWSEKEEQWSESKKNLEERIRALQLDLTQQSDLARAKNAGDARLQVSFNQTWVKYFFKKEQIQKTLQNLYLKCKISQKLLNDLPGPI